MEVINKILLQLPYALIFLPLIASIFVQFINDKKFLSNTFYVVITALLAISGILLMAISDGNTNLFVMLNNNINMLGTEYKLNFINLFYIISILFLNIIGFLNYRYEYPLSNEANIKYKKIFFSIYFIHLFSMIGIFTTYNIFHLFIFIELFSFSAFNLINSYEGKSFNVAVYKYFSNNIFGSMILACAIFYLTLFCNTNNILLIRQQILTTNIANNYFLILIYILLIIAISLKFLMFNVRPLEEKKRYLTIMSMENMFTSTVIGTFLIYFFTNFVFLLNNVFAHIFWIKQLMLAIACAVIAVVSVRIILKTKTVHDVFINLFFSDLVYIFIVMFFVKQNLYFKGHLLLFSEFIATLLPIYIISIYFSEMYDDNGIGLFRKHKYTKLFFLCIIIYKLLCPFAPSCYLLKYLFVETDLGRNIIFALMFIITKLALISILLKVIFNRYISVVDDNVIIGKKIIFRFKLSLVILFAFLIVMTFFLFLIQKVVIF